MRRMLPWFSNATAVRAHYSSPSRLSGNVGESKDLVKVVSVIC